MLGTSTAAAFRRASRSKRGQADLFLSGYLGIDFETKGRAVYRLLDATVTFHDRLPKAGEVIRYDIHIDEFFHPPGGQKTWLFRFRFDATVEGVPFLTMRDGIAGFFTEAELAAGAGVVKSTLAESMPRESTALASRPQFANHRGGLDLGAIRRGDLVAGLGLSPAVEHAHTIPGDRMALVTPRDGYRVAGRPLWPRLYPR